MVIAGAPDYTKQVQLLAKFGDQLVPVAVDSKGQLFALMQGHDGTQYRPLAVDSSGRLVAIMTGEYEGAVKALATDAAGRLQALLYGMYGTTPVAVAVSAEGKLSISEMDQVDIKPDPVEAQTWDDTLTSLISNLNRIRNMIVRITGEAWGTVSRSLVTIWAKFHSTDGHKHSGAADDAPPVPWANVADKPTAFPPTAHKATHATGGTDALAPADIGAVANVRETPSIAADLEANRPAAGVAGRLFIATDTKRVWRDTGTAWVSIPAVDWADIANKPSVFPPEAHAASHTYGGSDQVSGIHQNQLRKGMETASAAMVLAAGAVVIMPAGIWAVERAGRPMCAEAYVDDVWRKICTLYVCSGATFLASDGSRVRVNNVDAYPQTVRYWRIMI